MTAAAAQLQSLAGLVSSKAGIIRRMHRRIASADEPPIPIIYDSLLSNFDFRNGKELERGACGKGLTETAAQIGAIGEAIEHYCASHARVRLVRRARFNDLDNAIAPSDFVLYSETQYDRPGFRHVRWKPDSEIGWLEVRELPGHTAVWIPSGLVYLNFSGQQEQDFLCPPTSSGSAAGRDLEHAILSGLLETAERDAFVITWMNRLPVPVLDYSRLGGSCGIIRDYYARYGVEARAFLLATDLPLYAVMAIGLDHSPGGPAAVVGLGCALEAETALRRALFEICQVRPTERKKFAAGDAAKINAYSDVHTLEEHALYFTRHDHLHELEFLLSTTFHGEHRRLARPLDGQRTRRPRLRNERPPRHRQPRGLSRADHARLEGLSHPRGALARHAPAAHRVRSRPAAPRRSVASTNFRKSSVTRPNGEPRPTSIPVRIRWHEPI